MCTPNNHTNYEHDQSLDNQMVNPSPGTLSNRLWWRSSSMGTVTMDSTVANQRLKDKTLSEVVLNNGWANSREPKLRLELRNDTRGRNLNGGVIHSHSRDWSREVVWAVKTWTKSLATTANPFRTMHSSKVNLKRGLSYDVRVAWCLAAVQETEMN